MPMYVRESGVWKELDPQVNVSGTWKRIENAWVRVAGVWKQFYQYARVFLPDSTIFLYEDTFGDSAPAQKTGTLAAQSSGNLSADTRQNGGLVTNQDWTWLLQGSASDYDVRLTKSTGDDPEAGSSSLGTWLNLGSGRSWTWDVTTAGGSRSFTGTLSIRDTSTGDVLDTASVSVTLESL